MTIKEAILQTLKDVKKPAKHSEIYNYIIEKKYYSFTNGKTPLATVSALLGDFIRNNDSRVKRIKHSDATYSYYLKEYENFIQEDELLESKENKEIKKVKNYDERDLHKLLVTFLKTQNIYSTTIFHENSKNSSDDYQKWIHPDVIGVSFTKYKMPVTKNLLKNLDSQDAINLYSYEIKKEIKTDYELKKCFFQAVSNSSWSNYGYLVALEITDNIMDELERLHNSFGIGVIILSPNPYESTMLFTAKNKKLDYKTIDKLCNVNKKYKYFLEKVEAILTASDKYIKASEKDFFNECDSTLENEKEAKQYCKENNIPFDEKDFD